MLAHILTVLLSALGGKDARVPAMGELLPHLADAPAIDHDRPAVTDDHLAAWKGLG